MYFVIQRVSSLIILSSFLAETNSRIGVFVGLTVKLGLGPFFFWLPILVESLDWWGIFFVSTIQKFGPSYLLSLVADGYLTSLILFGSLSALIGAILGFKEINLKKLITYSSIVHLGWIVCSFRCSSILWFTYLSTYSLILLFLTIYLVNLNLVNASFSNPKRSAYRLWVVLLSLRGFPPTVGFYLKWLVFNALLSNGIIFWSFPLIFRRVVATGMYLYLGILFFNKREGYLVNRWVPHSQIFMFFLTLGCLPWVVFGFFS